MKEEIIEELKFCMKLWKTQGYCNFGSKTNCEKCGAPYILWKMLTGEVLHDVEMKRLSIEEWEQKINSIRE